MQCTSPIVLKPEMMLVPCGKCPHCRKQRANEWATRLLHESFSHDKSAFVTLTYDDRYAPASVSKRALQLFFKRLRKRLPDREIKYYACGEYGEKTGRPHYHAIIFGIEPCGQCWSCMKRNIADKPCNDCKIIRDIWTIPYTDTIMGYVNLGYVEQRSIRYVTGYINKALHQVVQGREQPFNIMSQGLGRAYCDTNAERLKRELGDRVNGAEIGLPKYYRKVLEVTTEELAEKAILKKLELQEHYEQKYQTPDRIWNHKIQSDAQRRINQIAKNQIYKREYDET